MLAAIAGAMLALGVLVVIHGLFPPKKTLAQQLTPFTDAELLHDEPNSFETAAVVILETVKGDKLDDYLSDVEVTDVGLAKIASEKLKAALGGGGLIATFAAVLGIATGPFGLLVALVIGAVVGYKVPDIELAKKAAERRTEFSRALTSFMTLLGSSISGGGGITTALKDASAMGDGWVFDKMRRALDEGHLQGISAWVALERLGRELRVVPLVELGSALTLAGASGARITDTLSARAESAREKELAEVRSDAEAKGSKLGLPVGLMLIAWAIFMAYPAVTSLVSS